MVIDTNMLKNLLKRRKDLYSKWGKWRKVGTVPVESENCVQVPGAGS